MRVDADVRSFGVGAMVAVCCLWLAGTEGAAEAAMPLNSGRPIGAEVPSFYVRSVTGPLRNRTVCYVCRNGDRPVVMVLMREIDHRADELFQGIDRIVDAHRADGLRAFGVLVDNQSTRAIPRLQTLGFDAKIALPLTVATDAICGPMAQNLHPDAATTIVLYRGGRVVRRTAFRAGELSDKQIERTLTSIRMFVQGPVSD